MTAYSINIPFNLILPNGNTFVLVFEIKKRRDHGKFSHELCAYESVDRSQYLKI